MIRQIWRWRRKAFHAFTAGTAATLYGWMVTRLLMAGVAPTSGPGPAPTLAPRPTPVQPSPPTKASRPVATAPPPITARSGAREVDRRPPPPQPRIRSRQERRPTVSPEEALERIPSCARGAKLLRALDEWADDECRRKFALSAHGILGAKLARCPGEWDASNLPSIVEHLREARATCGPSTVRALEEALSPPR